MQVWIRLRLPDSEKKFFSTLSIIPDILQIVESYLPDVEGSFVSASYLKRGNDFSSPTSLTPQVSHNETLQSEVDQTWFCEDCENWQSCLFAACVLCGAIRK
jgi:hypothetical protein